MRPRTLIAAAISVVTAGALVAPAHAQDGYSHGRLRYVEPGVTVQRATDVESDEAVANAPFLPGDRVWTDANGRAEFQFPDGSAVRLDRRSKLDYSGHEQDGGERVVLRLWSGSLILRVRSRGDERFEIETPAGLVKGLLRSVVRVDVDGGETRVSVYEGEAVLDDGGERPRLAAGEQTSARWGARAEEPTRFELDEPDDFLQWEQDREREERRSVSSARYLPDELDPYAPEFADNGSWGYEGGVGNVWIPRVEVGWQPYSNGHWTWTPYGWTWVPYERWGWAPFHYGRWGQSASLGWYWIPGRTWGPAWVSWAVGGGYVGWCPLGWRDRPVHAWGGYDNGRNSGRERGYAVLRGGSGGREGWHLIRQGELGRRDVTRRRIGVDRINPDALRVAESPRSRPTRDGLHLREGEAAPRAISRRPSPGDYVRELGVDNKTTIPAPWTRGYGPPPAGVEGARYGARGRERSGEQAEAGQSQGGTAATGATRQRTRPTPWYAPPSDSRAGSDGGAAAKEGGVRQQPREPQARTGVWRGSPDSESGGHRSRGESEGRAEYRPRSDGGARRTGGSSGESDGGSVYRSRPEGGGGSSRPSGGSSGESGGGYRPRHEGGGGGASRPSGGSGNSGAGGHARPSGSGSSSGGGHAVSRRGRN